MNREQAINYLICRGFTHEQVGDVVRALTYEPASLSVPEVTALAEWTAKLTKASEDAYNKGYAEVLDKIRAEIEQKLGTHGNISLYNRAIYDVLMIIGKYKAGSEDK